AGAFMRLRMAALAPARLNRDASARHRPRLAMTVPTSAPLWLRLAALVYDFFPLVALWMLTVAVSLLAVGGDVDVAHPPEAFHLAQQLALGAVTAAYFVVSWTRGGQTIGMRAWRLRVVAADGDDALPWR